MGRDGQLVEKAVLAPSAIGGGGAGGKDLLLSDPLQASSHLHDTRTKDAKWLCPEMKSCYHGGREIQRSFCLCAPPVGISGEMGALQPWGIRYKAATFRTAQGDVEGKAAEKRTRKGRGMRALLSPIFRDPIRG